LCNLKLFFKCEHLNIFKTLLKIFLRYCRISSLRTNRKQLIIW
jgi:hypothetical protein